MGEVVLEEGDGLGAGFLAGAFKHGLGEVEGGDARAVGGEAEGMAAGAAADIGDVEAFHVADERPDVEFFEEDEGVVFAVIHAGPAFVAVTGGDE